MNLINVEVCVELELKFLEETDDDVHKSEKENEDVPCSDESESEVKITCHFVKNVCIMMNLLP